MNTPNEPHLADQDIPHIPRGVRVHWCKIRKGWYLLAPERAVKMDAVAAAILQAVDGHRNFSAIVGQLAQDFEAPKAQIAADARKFLADLITRRMLEIRQ